MSLGNIANAWLKTMNHNDEEKEIAEERLSICNQCPFKKEMVGGLCVCGECMCPISFDGAPIGKCYTKENQCPMKYWKR